MIFVMYMYMWYEYSINIKYIYYRRDMFLFLWFNSEINIWSEYVVFYIWNKNLLVKVFSLDNLEKF